MNDNRVGMALLFPLLAVLLIVGYGGGLGVTFMVVYASFNEWGVVALGVALVVGVPTIAALLQRSVERNR